MLKGLGASDAGVAGFLGNVRAESGFKADAVKAKSGAYSLIQALGPRKAELFKTYARPRPSTIRWPSSRRNSRPPKAPRSRCSRARRPSRTA
ncbi:phage tail tip lysozyme [Methylobacterium sp. Leaf112]|uniref:phage tail tip lysozyme n=1 Tax=Methylobacterium sp. Leaf112 TaxID=1736258 RepID=UPI00138F6B69